MSQTTTLHIKGMHCVACEKIINRRLSTLPGVTRVTVSLKEGIAELQSENVITPEDASTVLTGTDYQVINSG